MAETKQETKQPEKKQEKAKEIRKRPEEDHYESLVRIYGFDIPGTKSLYPGLTRIKGVSWAVSKVICSKLGFPRDKKISELSKDEIAKIEKFLNKPELYDFMRNRRSDPETGEVLHLIGTDLDISREFDIKRMKRIKSYKGIRHTSKLPVRGQRTRSHFRAKGRATGMGNRKKPAEGKEAKK